MKKFILAGLLGTLFLFAAIGWFAYRSFPRKIKVYTLKKPAAGYNVPVIPANLKGGKDNVSKIG